MKYSDQISLWLKDLGYTHCFYVAGGNTMHMNESLSRFLICIPVLHEVAAGIACEYFNESQPDYKAIALVTAGPGLTNIVTAIAGAYLESRELLVIGGQVKTSDLSLGKVRQRGIQEIDGVTIVKSITSSSTLLTDVLDFRAFSSLVALRQDRRKAPVFIELPIDIQARDYRESLDSKLNNNNSFKSGGKEINAESIKGLTSLLASSQRPFLLIGGGVSRGFAKSQSYNLDNLSIPIGTTWNGADRISSDGINYFGRPNTWGQRSANMIMQQSDLIIAVGTRLGLQQTGFNWEEFAPRAKIIQVDIDESELAKGHPLVNLPICGDADLFLSALQNIVMNFDRTIKSEWLEWIEYAKVIRKDMPAVEDGNKKYEGYISPYDFMIWLSAISSNDDVVVPCSSGGSFTTFMQTFSQKAGQTIITNKGLASMGYGLAGAIGCCFAHPDKKVILIEGDGGLSQNLQELGTAAVNRLNLKVFIFDDGGYASIRMTQKNYFNGNYRGCDVSTGLGLPNWRKLSTAWDIECLEVNQDFRNNSKFIDLYNSKGVAVFIVKIHPEQTYYPKITSIINPDGSMKSNPLHKMSPELNSVQERKYLKYL